VAGNKRLLVGVGMGLLAGVSAVVRKHDGSPGETIGFGLLFAGLGFGGGYLIGGSFARWETLYAVPQGP
jgi:hypothetical protein